MIFNDRRKGNTEIKKALKAANGPSLAPRGYKPDTAGRAEINSDHGVQLANSGGQLNRKVAYNVATHLSDRKK